MENSLKLAIHHIEVAEQRIAEAKREIKKLRTEKRKLTFELTNKQIANILDCSCRTVIRMKNDGRLGSTKAIDILNFKRRY